MLGMFVLLLLCFLLSANGLPIGQRGIVGRGGFGIGSELFSASSKNIDSDKDASLLANLKEKCRKLGNRENIVVTYCFLLPAMLWIVGRSSSAWDNYFHSAPVQTDRLDGLVSSGLTYKGWEEDLSTLKNDLVKHPYYFYEKLHDMKEKQRLKDPALFPAAVKEAAKKEDQMTRQAELDRWSKENLSVK